MVTIALKHDQNQHQSRSTSLCRCVTEFAHTQAGSSDYLVLFDSPTVGAMRTREVSVVIRFVFQQSRMWLFQGRLQLCIVASVDVIRSKGNCQIPSSSIFGLHHDAASMVPLESPSWSQSRQVIAIVSRRGYVGSSTAKSLLTGSDSTAAEFDAAGTLRLWRVF